MPNTIQKESPPGENEKDPAEHLLATDSQSPAKAMQAEGDDLVKKANELINNENATANNLKEAQGLFLQAKEKYEGATKHHNEFVASKAAPVPTPAPVKLKKRRSSFFGSLRRKKTEA